MMKTKERPILFSAPMVRAIRDGRKTVTRRVVKAPAKNMQAAGMEVIKCRPPGDPWYKDHVWSMRGSAGVWGDYTHEQFIRLCPYGVPGDRLWVKETWYNDADPDARPRDMAEDRSHLYYRADGECCDQIPECQCGDLGKPKWRPSIFMRRWASRITLRVTDVRVERLHDITEEDARAEGVTPAPFCKAGRPAGNEHVEAFEALWREINGPESWDANPWVWRVGFAAKDGEG